jgi:hypothetical protein
VGGIVSEHYAPKCGDGLVSIIDTNIDVRIFLGDFEHDTSTADKHIMVSVSARLKWATLLI